MGRSLSLVEGISTENLSAFSHNNNTNPMQSNRHTFYRTITSTFLCRWSQEGNKNLDGLTSMFHFLIKQLLITRALSAVSNECSGDLISPGKRKQQFQVNRKCWSFPFPSVSRPSLSTWHCLFWLRYQINDNIIMTWNCITCDLH